MTINYKVHNNTFQCSLKIILILYFYLFLYTILNKKNKDKYDINNIKINNDRLFNNSNIYKDKINQLKKEILIVEKNLIFQQKLLNKINKIYSKEKIVNINKIEASINGGRKWENNFNKSNEINIGFQLDPDYILRTMMTLASILDSQKNNTKLRLHFAVVLNFTAENMLKIYSLREIIRDDVEFNFYNAEKVEIDFKGVHPKGPGAIAKILLPHLLPKDIDRLIIFDTGDVLILRDLTEMYNWEMGDYLYLGAPDPCIGKIALISKKPYDVYINIGHFLLNVKKIKEENMYEKYLKYKNVYNNIICDQDLLNDVAQDQIGYLPVRFGLFSPFVSDSDSDNSNIINQYEFYNMNENKLKNKFPFLPKNSSDYFRQSSNPVVIHQWNGKWAFGSGLSIYRRLAQNYIRLAGIWDEFCQKHMLFCVK